MPCRGEKPEYAEYICASCEHTTIRVVRSYFTRMQLKYIALTRALDGEEEEDGQRQSGGVLGSSATPSATLNELRSPGRLHMMTLLRDPFERLVSWFFYVRPGCSYRHTEEKIRRAVQNGFPMDWLMENKPEFICRGDFESFVPYAKENEAQSVRGRLGGGVVLQGGADKAGAF